MRTKIELKSFCLSCLLLLLPALISSCQHDEADGDPQVNITADITLNMPFIALDGNQTRAVGDYHHRFIAIAYDGKNEVARQVLYADVNPAQPSVSLPISMKLHPRNYKLVVWADYVIQAEKGYALLYDTGNMERIERADSYKGNSLYYDAFYGTAALDLTSHANQPDVKVPVEVTMNRPLARYELIATDVEKFLQKIKDKQITGSKFTLTVKYGYYLTTGFNALTGQVKHPMQYISYSKTIDTPTADTKELNVGFDYVLVNGEGSFVSLTIEITNEKNVVVARYRDLKVPYEQNHLTTIRGKFLTANPGIDIDTDFDDDIIVDLDRLN